MELETPAKTALAFTVPVANWLRRTQRCGGTDTSSLMVLVVLSCCWWCLWWWSLGFHNINYDDDRSRPKRIYIRRNFQVHHEGCP